MSGTFFQDSKPTLPLEFVVLGFSPEPWTLADSLCWAKIMSYDLSRNLVDELQNMALLSLGVYFAATKCGSDTI
jgi:penicillin amidase